MPRQPKPAELALDIYARVSRLSDDRMRSTDGQVEDCRQRVEERGATVGEILVDPNRSAWNPKVRRLEWHRLMERLEAGETGGVIVFDLARFSRRPIEGERLIAAAERGLVVLDSEGEYDLTSASGKKAFRDQMSAAAYESDRLSTRIRRGKKQKAAAGESNHTQRPFGFEPDGYTPREPEAAELRSLTERFLAGEAQELLAVELNARGVPTSTGNIWDATRVRQVLTRPRNAGLIEYKGEIVGVQVGVDPVIPRDQWDQVMAMYAARRQGRPGVYLLSGLVHCGLCGYHLTGRPRVRLKTYPDGSITRDYHCHQRRVTNDGGCGQITIDQRALDEHVGALVVAILADPQHAAAIEEAASAVRSARREIEASLGELEHTAVELAARLGRGELTLARHDAAVGPLDRRIAELRAQLGGLGSAPVALVTPAMAAATRAEWSARWTVAPFEERRLLVRQALQGRQVRVMPHVTVIPRAFDKRRVVLV